MTSFILRRLALSVVLLFIISIISFFIVTMTPGSPYPWGELNPKISAEVKANFRKKFHLDRPLHEQYTLMMKDLFTGDLRSIKDDRPVMGKIMERLPATLALNITAILISLSFGTLLGVYAARNAGKWQDMAGSFVAFLFIALLAGGTALLSAFDHHWPFDPNLTNLEQKLLPPSAQHWLGTDNLGRDVLSRMLHGASISLTVGLIAVFVSLAIGMVVGAIAGYFGGLTDQILMRSVDALLCFPTFFLILTAVALLGPSLLNIVVVIGFVSWTGNARLVRGEFLTLRETEYVKGARILGQNAWRIITRHILPNAAAPILVTAVLGIPDAILSEAGLSFLGFGVQPPQATWGNIIADGKTYLLDAWWLILFPGLAILIASLSFYLAGDALREAAESRS